MMSAHLIAILYLSATPSPTLAYQAPIGARALRSRVAAPATLTAATLAIPDVVPAYLVAEAVAPVKTRPSRAWIPALAFSSALCYVLTLLLATLSGPVAQATKVIFAGAVAGVISRSFCAPLEMVSTVMMCATASPIQRRRTACRLSHRAHPFAMFHRAHPFAAQVPRRRVQEHVARADERLR